MIQAPFDAGVPLASYTTLGTGGLAQYWVNAQDEAQVLAALDWANRHDTAVLVLGGGSNLVCADEGFAGLVIQMGLLGIEARPVADAAGPARVRVVVGAGEPWDDFVAHCVAQRWSGLECLSGIPGLVGGTPLQNVGAYGQEVSQVIEWVECVDKRTLKRCTFKNADCDFAYRSSRFKTHDADRFVVTRVSFLLVPEGPPTVVYPELSARLANAPVPTLTAVREAVLEARRDKSMVLDPADPNTRSCGSFFVNPTLPRADFERLQSTFLDVTVPHYSQPDGTVKVPAAWLIERAGFKKGQRDGNVGLSTRHALCVICYPGGSSTQVRDFARAIKVEVQRRFGVLLDAEPRFVGLDPP